MPKRRRYGGGRSSHKRARTSRRTRKQSFRRRSSRRGRSRYNASASTRMVTPRGRSGVNLRALGLPSSMIAHLVYRDYGNKSPTVAAVGTQQYNLSSCYDPDFTGSGTQPRYFDQLCTSTLYSRFLVYRADVTVTFRNRGSSDAICGVRILDSSSVPWSTGQDVFYAGEFPYCASRMLGDKDSSTDTTVFKFTLHHHKFHGITKTKLYSDDIYHGVYNGNPNDNIYMNLGVADDPADATGGANVDYETSIVYHVKFYDLEDIVAQS